MARTNNEWVGKNDDSRPHTAVRRRLLELSGFRCQICGHSVDGKKWEADHITRLMDGGENRETNLQVACIQCHKEKTGQENKSQAKGDRNKNRHYGIKKKSRYAETKERLKLRYNWAKGRYERDD
jgi:5-methylcytosine-specific restriction protein A